MGRDLPLEPSHLSECSYGDVDITLAFYIKNGFIEMACDHVLVKKASDKVE